MIAQRPADAAPVVRAFAEELPFEDGSFDAAMVVLSDHHWRDHFPCFEELIPSGYRLVMTIERLDGFFHAYWRRPKAYRAPAVRAGVSAFTAAVKGWLSRGLSWFRHRIGALGRTVDLLNACRSDVGAAIGW
jgi:SAM-dependent methyltransferase